MDFQSENKSSNFKFSDFLRDNCLKGLQLESMPKLLRSDLTNP